MNPEVTENKLISKAQKGDVHAFAELMKSYMPYVYSVTARILGDEMEADDITQEVFIRAHKYLSSFRGHASFKTWLYRIAVNQALKHIRKMKKSRFDRSIDEAVHVEDTTPNPLDRAIRTSEMQQLKQAVANLPFKQRTVLQLRITDNLSFKEIAYITHRTIGSVKANYFHAIRNLKKQIGKET